MSVADDHVKQHTHKLLGELAQARDAVQMAMPEYVRAIKQWADVERTVGDRHVKLVDALLTKRNYADRLTDAQMANVERIARDMPDTTVAWRRLVEATEEWEPAIRELFAAEGRYINYVNTTIVEQTPSVLSVLQPYEADSR